MSAIPKSLDACTDLVREPKGSSPVHEVIISADSRCAGRAWLKPKWKLNDRHATIAVILGILMASMMTLPRKGRQADSAGHGLCIQVPSVVKSTAMSSNLKNGDTSFGLVIFAWIDESEAGVALAERAGRYVSCESTP